MLTTATDILKEEKLECGYTSSDKEVIMIRFGLSNFRRNVK